ncbi:unnamed protein product, partial [Didymodactylos carnosus]
NIINVNLHNELIKNAILKELHERGKMNDLMSYEQVKNIAVISEPFTIENGLLTPTFKIRRYAVEKKYKQTLEGLYKNLQYNVSL